MVAAVTGFPARSRLRPHGGPAPSRRYERRRLEKTPLHRVVSENLESWLAWREAAERPVPGSVEEELRGYLEAASSASDSPVLAARAAASRPWKKLVFSDAAGPLKPPRSAERLWRHMRLNGPAGFREPIRAGQNESRQDAESRGALARPSESRFRRSRA